MKQGPYKPTGNLYCDLVAGCMNHFERQGAKVATIYLQPKYWRGFMRYVLSQIPGHVDTGEIDFDGTIVKKASILQWKSLSYELEGSGKKHDYDA